jgi:hypothetical protein
MQARFCKGGCGLQILIIFVGVLEEEGGAQSDQKLWSYTASVTNLERRKDARC